MRNPFAAGALRSTPNDLVAWDAALRGDTLLTADSRAAMTTGEKEGGGLGPGGKYAYGVVVGELFDRPYINHDGGINGFGTVFTRFPEDEIVVVAYSNRLPFPIHLLGLAAVHLTFGEEPPPPPTEIPAHPIPDAVRKKLAGSYVLDDAGRKALVDGGVPEHAIESISPVTLDDRDGRLFLRSGLDDDDPSLMHAAEGGLLFTRVSHLTLTFDTEAPKVDTFTARQGPLTVTFKRASRTSKKTARKRR
jgi:CubicO group peptidase (beta-lactamase class C family)